MRCCHDSRHDWPWSLLTSPRLYFAITIKSTISIGEVASGTVMRACLTDAAVAARDFMVLHCGHEDNPCAPSECLADLVSECLGSSEPFLNLHHQPSAQVTSSCMAHRNPLSNALMICFNLKCSLHNRRRKSGAPVHRDPRPGAAGPPDGAAGVCRGVRLRQWTAPGGTISCTEGGRACCGGRAP